MADSAQPVHRFAHRGTWSWRISSPREPANERRRRNFNAWAEKGISKGSVGSALGSGRWSGGPLWVYTSSARAWRKGGRSLHDEVLVEEADNLPVGLAVRPMGNASK